MAKDLVPLNPPGMPAPKASRTWLPVLVLGSGGIFAFAALGLPVVGALLVAASFAWLVLGLASAARRKVLSIESGAAGRDSESPQDRERKELKRKLYRLSTVDGCEARAERAGDQILQAEQRFKLFRQLLEDKLDPSELTFSRYFGAAEQVYLSIYDRLGEVEKLLSSVSAIQPTELSARLASAPEGEAATLRERLKLVEAQQAKADDLLSSNEQALTHLDRANVAMTEMKTKAGMAVLGHETAMLQLEDLAKRTQAYSRSDL
jgi:hypothetical protein